MDRPPLALGPSVPSPLHPSTIFSLQALLRRNGLPDGRLNLMRGDDHAASLRWGTNNGLKSSCSIAQIWRPADPFHDGNGGILSFDKTRAVFLKCLHPECQRLSSGRGIFLGYIPPCTASLNLYDKDVSVSSTLRRGVKRTMPDSAAPFVPLMTVGKKVAHSQGVQARAMA